ncbi:hypothetical protein MHYP_G00317240 [Metynnis hypsauchen]
MRPKVKAQRRARSPRALDPGDIERGGGEEARGAANRARKKGFKPPDVRTIFEECVQDPRVKEEKGEGHMFTLERMALELCDVCCRFIFQDGLVCTGCKYTCHAQCRDRVTLDCHPNSLISPLSQDHLNNNQSSQSVSLLLVNVRAEHAVMIFFEWVCIGWGSSLDLTIAITGPSKACS